MSEHFLKLSKIENKETLKQVFSLLVQLRPSLSYECFIDLKEKMYQASSYDALILKNETECISYISFEFINRYSFNGKFLYIADFVTHDAYRSKGYGKIMLKKIREIAKINHCENIVLESGISRKDAHRFYENNNFAIQSYSFRQKL